MIRIHGTKYPAPGATEVFSDQLGYEVIILSGGAATVNGAAMRTDTPYFVSVETPLTVLAGEDCYIQTIRRES